MKTTSEICEWIRIEEMKYAYDPNCEMLVMQSLYAMAFASSITPKMMCDLYAEHKKLYPIKLR